MEMTLAELARVLQQPAPINDRQIEMVVIDSRLVKPGDVFVAIIGDRLDGHDFIEQAIAQGAIAIVAHHAITALVPVFQVQDTTVALGQIAAAYRCHFQLPVIGITGSCGKTSTKTFTASVLAQKGKTLATDGTLNNHWGVPQTLFRLTSADQYAVIEMGANHRGEINYLAQIVQPTVAVVTNTGPVHLEGFGSLEGVHKGKGELYQNITSKHTAIINIHDAATPYWLTLLPKETRTIFFGYTPEADVRADDITLTDTLQPVFKLHIRDEYITVQLPTIGDYQVSNALIAAAIGWSQGLSLLQIKNGLESAPLVEKRGIMQRGYHDLLIIDDSYNANPTAFVAAIDLLMSVPQMKRRIVVMGDMKELGSQAEYFHAEVAAHAEKIGIDEFYTVGSLSAAASKRFGVRGKHFPDQQSLIDAIKKIAHTNVCVLIKGSKSSLMGNVVAALTTGTQ